LGPAPYEMLIRLMRLSSEHDDNTQSLDIFEKANEQLTALAEFGPEDSARRRILEQCVQDIRVMNGSVTGSCSVILAFLREFLVPLLSLVLCLQAARTQTPQS
jgi:hypothetical protein